jgi:hypothetical protein
MFHVLVAGLAAAGSAFALGLSAGKKDGTPPAS